MLSIKLHLALKMEVYFHKSIKSFKNSYYIIQYSKIIHLMHLEYILLENQIF